MGGIVELGLLFDMPFVDEENRRVGLEVFGGEGDGPMFDWTDEVVFRRWDWGDDELR